MTRLFVSGYLLALPLQGNAAALTTKKETQALGTHIVVAGLCVQLFDFGFFVVAAAVFDVRMRRDVGANKDESESRRPDVDVPWRQGLKMLYACSALIIMRSVFRVVEYVMGLDGYPLSHEWALYVFDAVLMAAVQVIFLVWFPDRFHVGRGDGGENHGHVLVGDEELVR